MADALPSLVDTQHPKYTHYKPIWDQIDNICDGEEIEQYIVDINPNDKTEANKARNKQFKKRAIFYAIAGYTARGMNGMLFAKDPNLSVPSLMEYVQQNVDGAGVSIYQQAQHVARDLIRKGRAGLLVDFPPMSGAVSVAEIRNRRVYATIQRYQPEQIINWETKTEGAETFLSLVILYDVELRRQPGMYQQEKVEIILELFLSPGFPATDEEPGQPAGYVVRRWVNGAEGWHVEQQWQPRNSAGQPWQRIPFTFVGSETNTESIDQPPMRDIVRINIGHYNNSAIYEDSVFNCGQVQPWISGLSQAQAKELQSEGFYWGSGTVLPVPDGGQAGIEQAQPNTLAKEAMSDKVDLAIGIGAMFIQPGNVNKTATQSQGEQRTQHSVLSLISNNLSEAYTKCLGWMQEFMGGAEEVDFNLADDFVEPTATAQELQAMVASMMQGAIPWSDFVRWCQSRDLIDAEKTAEEVAEEVGRNDDMPDLSGGAEE